MTTSHLVEISGSRTHLSNLNVKNKPTDIATGATHPTQDGTTPHAATAPATAPTTAGTNNLGYATVGTPGNNNITS